MSAPQVLDAIADAGIVPVIVLDDPDAAAPLADALVAGGVRCAEVTLRTAGALRALRTMAERPDLLVGAGTVLDPEQAGACLDAGARFAVSPGFDDAVVERCLALGLPVLPGTATATEALRARRAGLTAVKFFPAHSSGGLPALSALSAALGGLRFMPTGGIGPAELPGYLGHPAVLAVGGSWMVPSRLIAQRGWTEITELCGQAVRTVAQIRGR